MSVTVLAKQTTPYAAYSSGPCSGGKGKCNEYGAMYTQQTSNSCLATAPTGTNQITPCPVTSHECSSTSPDASTGTCNNDWAFLKLECKDGWQNHQYLCSQVDPTRCPTLGTAAPIAQAQWYQPLATATTDGTVQCTYDPAEVASSSENLNAFLATFLPSTPGTLPTPVVPTDGVTSAAYQTVMSQYCQQTTDNCINGLGKCCRVFENVPNNPCMTWYNDLQVDAARKDSYEVATKSLDTFIANYCGNPANNANPDCNCYNRTKNPIFQLLQKDWQQLAGCFWPDCLPGTTVNLVQPEILPNSRQQCGSVCENVVQYLDGQPNVTQSEINQYIACAGSGGNGPAAPPGPGSSNLWIVGLIAMVAILLITLLLIVIRQAKPAAKIPTQ